MTDLLTENARLRAALELAANRLLRCAVDYDAGTRRFIETGEWANEARAALAPDAPCSRPQDITDQELQEFGIMDRILPVGGLGPKQEPMPSALRHVETFTSDRAAVYLGQHIAAPAPDAVQEAAIDIEAVENGGKRWHGEDHRVVAVRWEPYKPDGQRQMKAKGRWQEQVGSGDYWRWNNCDRPSALRAIAGRAPEENQTKTVTKL